MTDVTWINANGGPMQDEHWEDTSIKCFGMLLDGMRHYSDAAVVAERIIETLRRPIPMGDATVNIGASVGVAVVEDPVDAPLEWPAYIRMSEDIELIFRTPFGASAATSLGAIPLRTSSAFRLVAS